MKHTLFDELGGTPCLERVHRIFYDKLLSHPWLKDFFVGKEQSNLESQQTDFMTGLFGGPKVYGGRLPKDAHIHLFITEEVFELRHKILEQSLKEANVPPHLREKWLMHDASMKRVLTKASMSECQGRYKMEKVISVQRPDKIDPI